MNNQLIATFSKAQISVNETHLKYFRLTLLVVGISILCSGLVFKYIIRDMYDPYYLRVLLVLPFFIVYATSYAVKFIEKNFRFFFNGCLSLILLWSLYIAGKNDYSIITTTILILVASINTAALDKAKFIPIYSVVIIAITVVLFVKTSIEPELGFTIVLAILTAHFVIYLVLKSKERTVKSLMESEHELVEIAERFKSLHNASFGGIAIHDKGIILESNQGLSDMTGYSLDELIGMNGLLLISPEYREMVIEKIVTGYEKPYEANGIRKNGEEFPMRLEARNIPYKGKIVRTVEFRDITENKQAELLLQETNENLIQKNAEIEFNNARLESLLKIAQYSSNSIQELLDFVLNEAIKLTKSKIGYIYYYNNSTKQFILNSWSKDVMRECMVMNPQNVYDLDKTGLWGEAVRQHKPIVMNNYEEENPLKKGTPHGHVQLKKFLTIPVIVDTTIVAVCGVANKDADYDNSDVRQLTLLMDSVWKITERTTMIKQLTLAKERAEESDRLKSAFLANMSHEIRTPMNGILGFADLLKEPGLSGDKQHEYIKIIEKSGTRMLNIINDIVDISKIEAGLMELHMNDSNINEQIEYVYAFFKPEAEAKKIKLSFNNPLSAKDVTIKTDREKLYAILINLVKNALKYTHEGSIELGYNIVESTHASSLQFYVKDTGIGIPKERQEAIFDRFIQADIEDRMAYQGAGLGLSITKAYVEMLGGDIWVESEEGEGSVFCFTLPYDAERALLCNNQSLPSSEESYVVK